MRSEAPRIHRSGCWLTLACFVLLVVVPIVVAVVLASREPASYSPPRSEDPVVLERASVFEKNFVSELTRVREQEEPWGVRIRERDLNAWLWVRFPAWVAHVRGEGAFGTEPMLQAEFESRQIRIASKSVVVALEPRVEDGRTRIYGASGNAVGRLPVPGFMFDRMLQAIDFEALGEVFTESEPGSPIPASGELALPSRFRLGDGRTVELIEIQLDEDEAVLIFRTRGAEP